MLSIFSDYNGMKLEINLKKKSQKDTKIWRLNNMLLNSEWVNNEIREEIKRYLSTNENENTMTPKSVRDSKSSSKVEIIALQA